MKAVLYRIAAVLLVLFAIGHTLGFRQDNPEWGATSVIRAMQAYHFNSQGFNRTYWDFFSAFGLFFSVFVLFAAALAWQLAGFTSETLANLRGIQWSLAICFPRLPPRSFSHR